MRPTTAILIALALTSLSHLLRPPGAHALELASGRVVLPLSGLVIDLPAHAGTYEVKGLYRLVEGSTYSAVETIYQRDPSKRILETFSIRHGKLKTGCQAFLEAELASGPGVLRAASAFGVTGMIGTSKRRPEVAFCTTPRTESVVVTLTLSDRALTEEQLVQALTSSPIAAAVVAAASDRRVEVVTPLARTDVTATASSRPYPAPIRLPKLATDLALPSDGFVWIHDAETSKDRIGDYVASIFPSATDLGITVALMGRGDCAKVWRREGGTVSGQVGVAGFAGDLYLSRDGLRHEAHLCRAKADRLIIAQIGALAPLGDLERFAPILTAIDQALSRLPAPPPGRAAGHATSTPPHATTPPGRSTPIAPPRHPPRPYTAESTDGFLFMQFGTELIVSSRDTGGRDEDLFPETRFTGPGLAMDFIFEAEGFLARTGFAATYDLGGVFSGDATSSARWGASHLEGAFELGYASRSANTGLVLGFMAGWTGMSGPLTLNSSLSVSAVFGMVPESPGDFGWLLRATPIQLLAANERELMSPFEIELHLTPGESLGVTLGFQWIGAPEVGDQDIPAEGFAFSLVFGTVFFGEP